MRYDIFLGNEKAGQATLERQGLYYKIECRCHLSGTVRFHVAVKGDKEETNLGLLIPGDGGFYLRTSVAVKKLGSGNLRFCLIPVHPKVDGMFVPLRPDEPFAYLARLKEAVLQRSNGEWGLVLHGVSSDSSKPTGQ